MCNVYNRQINLSVWLVGFVFYFACAILSPIWGKLNYEEYVILRWKVSPDTICPVVFKSQAFQEASPGVSLGSRAFYPIAWAALFP